MAKVDPLTPRGARQRPLLLPFLPKVTQRSADRGITPALKGITPRVGDWLGCPLAQLALHNPHIWANSLKPVCFLCFLLLWCPLLPFIETGTLKIYTKMVLYMKNELLTSNTPHGV